jgi:hypothetical protein
MMPTLRRFADQSEILSAIRDRLKAVCPGCAQDKHCFVSDQAIPDDSIWPSVSHFVTVSTGPGSFDQSLFSGGGARTLNEDSQIVVTVLVQMNLDRIPSGEQRLLHDKRGLLSVWKKNILTSLLLSDVTDPTSKAWEPTIETRPLLRNQLRPLHASEPADATRGMGWCGLSITFSCSFDWNLGIVPIT